MGEVLLVMRRPGNAKVLGEALARQGYGVRSAGDAAELRAILDRVVRPTAALVDVGGYGEDVWSLCGLLQREQVPFLVVSAPHQTAAGSRGLEAGAAIVLTKPLVKSSLLRALAGLMAR